MSLIGYSRYEGLRCPHCAGKLPGYVSRDAELARIREETQKDAEVIRLSNQLRGAVEAERKQIIDRILHMAAVTLPDDISQTSLAIEYVAAILAREWGQ